MDTSFLRSPDFAAIAVGTAIGAILLAFVVDDEPDPRAALAEMAAALPASASADGGPAAAAGGGARMAPATRPRAGEIPGAAPPPSAAPTTRQAPDPNPLTESGTHVVQAKLKGAIARSLRSDLGPHTDVVSALFGRLVMWDLNLRRELWAGDEMAIAYTVAEGGEGPEITIEGARYRSQKLDRTLTAYRFHATGDAFPSYWSADGTEVPFRLRDSPIEGYEQITSLLRDRPGHEGMDFMAPVGTEVRSPFDGVVTRVNWNRAANGRCVEVRFADGAVAKYLHLDETSVRHGQRVRAGEVIGLSGNTGRSTGPHLHYQIERGTQVLDPIDVHGTVRRALPDADREAFRARVAEVDALLDG